MDTTEKSDNFETRLDEALGQIDLNDERSFAEMKFRGEVFRDTQYMETESEETFMQNE